MSCLSLEKSCKNKNIFKQAFATMNRREGQDSDAASISLISEGV